MKIDTSFQEASKIVSEVSYFSALDPRTLDTLEKMAKGRKRAMPVVDREGQLVGLLTTADVNEAYRLFSIGQNVAPATR